MQWIQENYNAVIAILLMLLTSSELIGLAPWLKSNSIVQLLISVLKAIGGKK